MAVCGCVSADRKGHQQFSVRLKMFHVPTHGTILRLTQGVKLPAGTTSALPLLLPQGKYGSREPSQFQVVGFPWALPHIHHLPVPLITQALQSPVRLRHNQTPGFQAWSHPLAEQDMGSRQASRLRPIPVPLFLVVAEESFMGKGCKSQPNQSH